MTGLNDLKLARYIAFVATAGMVLLVVLAIAFMSKEMSCTHRKDVGTTINNYQPPPGSSSTPPSHREEEY